MGTKKKNQGGWGVGNEITLENIKKQRAKKLLCTNKIKRRKCSSGGHKLLGEKTGVKKEKGRNEEQI